MRSCSISPTPSCACSCPGADALHSAITTPLRGARRAADRRIRARPRRHDLPEGPVPERGSLLPDPARARGPARPDPPLHPRLPAVHRADARVRGAARSRAHHPPRPVLRAADRHRQVPLQRNDPHGLAPGEAVERARRVVAEGAGRPAAPALHRPADDPVPGVAVGPRPLLPLRDHDPRALLRRGDRVRAVAGGPALDGVAAPRDPARHADREPHLVGPGRRRQGDLIGLVDRRAPLAQRLGRGAVAARRLLVHGRADGVRDQPQARVDRDPVRDRDVVHDRVLRRALRVGRDHRRRARGDRVGRRRSDRAAHLVRGAVPRAARLGARCAYVPVGPRTTGKIDAPVARRASSTSTRDASAAGSARASGSAGRRAGRAPSPGGRPTSGSSGHRPVRTRRCATPPGRSDHRRDRTATSFTGGRRPDLAAVRMRPTTGPGSRAASSSSSRGS